MMATAVLGSFKPIVLHSDTFVCVLGQEENLLAPGTL